MNVKEPLTPTVQPSNSMSTQCETLPDSASNSKAQMSPHSDDTWTQKSDQSADRCTTYTLAPQMEQPTATAQPGQPSVLFEQEHVNKPAPIIPPRSQAGSSAAWNTLTSVPSRGSATRASVRSGRGRRASVTSLSGNGADGPRRLSYSSYNDDPTQDNSDVVIGHGTTHLQSGARIPHDVKDIEKGEEEHHDYIIVEWDGDDKELGTRWGYPYRIYVTLLVGSLTIASTLASSLPSGMLPKLTEHFHVSDEVIKLSTFIFVGGYCVGPLVWAPYSELYGVRWPFILSMAGSTIFNMASALSPNIGALIAFRFLAGAFGSCPLVVGGGAMANIWPKELLGLGMCMFSMAPMAGPSLGPLIGGYVEVVPDATWRWGYWACTILTSFLTLLTFLTMKETNQVITLKQKAKRIRKQTGDDRYKAPVELRRIELRELVTRWFILPVLIFVYEPMLQAITMYMSFVYGVLYLFFEAFPIVFAEEHGLNAVQVGLTFLGFFTGCLIGGGFYMLVENRRYVKMMKTYTKGAPPPEQRMMVCMYGAPMLAISLFWFGWTSYGHISIWSPIGATVIYGIAMFFIFFSLMTFIADSYRAQTACALSANTVVRSTFGLGFPLMYNKLNPRWATFLLALISVLLLPIPFVLYKYGPWLRSKAKYAFGE